MKSREREKSTKYYFSVLLGFLVIVRFRGYN